MLVQAAVSEAEAAARDAVLGPTRRTSHHLLPGVAARHLLAQPARADG